MSQKPTLQHSVTKHRHPKKTHLRPDGSSDGVGGKRTQIAQVIALNRHGRATETETGEVIALGNNQITLTTADQVSWIVKARGAQIMDDDNHRITYGQLTIGSTVTITSYAENWKQLMTFWIGKRTEIGQVIALGSNQITLTNTAPDPETWTVDVSDGSAVITDPNNNSSILYLQLTIGSTVKVQSDGANWKQLA